MYRSRSRSGNELTGILNFASHGDAMGRSNVQQRVQRELDGNRTLESRRECQPVSPWRERKLGQSAARACHKSVMVHRSNRLKTVQLRSTRENRKWLTEHI
jgi:hypothetical protein